MKQNLQNLTIATALFGGLVGAAYGSGGSDHTKDPTAAHAADPASLSAVGAVRQTARAVISGVGVESGIASTRANRALAALRPRVRKLSDPDALQVAFLAYFRYQQAHPERVRKPYLYFVDYGLGSSTPRGYVFDMKDLKVVDGPFTETKESVGGYILIEAGSLEEAEAIAREKPMVPCGLKVEVRPVSEDRPASRLAKQKLFTATA